MKNPFYTRALKVAVQLLRQPKRFQKLLDDVGHAISPEGRKEGKAKLNRLVSQLQLILAMVQDAFQGRYSGLSTQSMIRLVAGLLYFVWVVDLIPDFIAVLGFLDDAAVIAWVYDGLREEIEAYRQWKRKV